jgi:hypothetical protein
LVSEYKLFKVKILKCDRFINILVLKGFRYHPMFNLTFFPQNFSFIILLCLSCIWRIRIWIWIHWLCWFRNGVFFKRLMTLTEKSILYNFFLFKSRFCSWLREKQEKSELSCVVQSLTSISNNLPSLRWHWPLTLKINKVPDSLKD